MIEKIKSSWFDLTSKYTNDEALINTLWSELHKKYAHKNRHYHNLSHIESMLLQAENIKSHIEDFPALLYAIWYHDIIYKSTKKDNEEKSALFTQKSLKKLNFTENQIENVKNLIISTKKHQVILDKNSDNAYLLDFDLSILGKDWETYKNYTQQIRQEYKIYPDFLYNPGRKKVLLHFLERETLYFTESYKTQFENKARENIKRELETL
ncbi:hypothetical protein [Winogradskyella sp. SYSU M77433]|uniref:HD domain-containing protein n=1 Tax=Winogradskyella sp. SYSU M77433 TaxID=3042722 RepID=UPI0024813D3B|nr:hypothetical protein [Winogradskyella sp. SYSU M77433]MDH7913509.1 hypothetical protein [Winogradskyella sp. SYSU M77433]